MSDRMTFPDTVEEFMEQYKVVDTDGVYMSKGAELVPIFRMEQWFEQLPSAQPERMNVNLQVEKLSKHQSDFTDLDAQPEQRWIPCSERLPEGQTEVIVSCMDNSGDTEFLYTSSGWMTTDREYWIVDNEINSFVIAWMPLPEPYKTI